jgi:hypothetical protein
MEKMTFSNKTQRETHLNWLMRDWIKSVLSLTVLINLNQHGSSKGTYFSERLKV